MNTQITTEKINEIGSKIVDKISVQLEDATAEFQEFFGRLIIYVGFKYFEISEAVSESLQYAYGTDSEFREEIDNMTEEEAEEYFNQQYEEELEEINRLNAVYVNANIDTPKYNIHIEPLECSGDYCMVGLVAEIEIKSDLSDIDIDNIAKLIATIYQL